jgi:uncharacterized protein YuzE
VKNILFILIYVFLFIIVNPSFTNNFLENTKGKKWNDFYKQNNYFENTKIIKVSNNFKTPQKVDIFKINKNKLTFNEFINIAKNKFFITGKAKKTKRSYRIDGDKYRIRYKLATNMISIRFLKDVLGQSLSEKEQIENFPSYEKCIEIAQNALERYNLSHSEMYFFGTTDTRELGGDAQIHLDYCRKINGIKCVGPNNFLMISINKRGLITRLLWKWQKLEKIGEYRIISPQEALNNFRAGQGDIFIDNFDSKVGNILKIDLAYVTDALNDQLYVAPWYQFKVEKMSNTRGADKTVKFITPAVENLEFYPKFEDILINK